MSAPQLARRSEINTTLWDDLIRTSRQRCIYGYSWYLDCVSPDWSALVWPSVSDYKVVLPLPIVKKWGFSVIRQPFFCQYLGFFSSDSLSSDLVEAFLKKVARHFYYISSYNFHPHNTPLLAGLLPAFPDLVTQQLATHWIYLSKTYAELQSHYSKDKKENLKRAAKENWLITLSQNSDSLIRLFKKNHESQLANGVSEASYQILQNLINQLINKKLCSVLYASLDANNHAGVCIVKEGSQHIYLFNAADLLGRKGNARALILDNYFRQHTPSADFFDFESPSQPSIAKNYLGYGAEEVTFYSVRKNKLPFPLRKWQEKRILKSTTKK